MDNAALDVLAFLVRYPGMRGRRIKGEEIPQHTPYNPNTASRVEDDSPAIMGDDRPTEEVRQANSEAEP